MKKFSIIFTIFTLSVQSVFAFLDIRNSDFEEYIDKMLAENLISGYSDGIFRPMIAWVL